VSAPEAAYARGYEIPGYKMSESPWVLAAVIAAVAGWTDWRARRIPNWLTALGLLLGITANSLTGGWYGAKESLLGAGLGLALLLPFVVIRSLGAGDWKLVGAIGSCIGSHNLLTVLFITILVNGLIALVMIIHKKRIRQTALNLTRMLASLVALRVPGQELTLENPDAVKVPFGVAVAAAMIFSVARHAWGSR
jgi:prepilin peptidase CpaA